MTSLRTNATLPVSTILGSNPGRIREHLTELEGLQKSLQDHGMLLPVLLTQDWELVDGARRVAAAQNLGWVDVPVLIGPEWPTVIAYFKEATRLAGLGQQAVPMTWMELADLWGGPITRLYHNERIRRMVETRRRTRAGEVLAQPETTATGITQDLAAMFGYSDNDVKMLRDIRSSWNRMAEQGRTRQAATEARKLINDFYQWVITIDKDPRPTHGTGRLREIMHGLAGHRMTLAEANQAVAKFQERRATKSKPHVIGTRVRDTTTRLDRPDTSTAAGRLVDMLVTVANEADHFDFDLAPVTPDQAAALADLILRCSLKTNKLKRQLLTIAEAPNPTNQRSTSA